MNTVVSKKRSGTAVGTTGLAQSVALQGISGTLVTIEADCGPGLPGLSIVGLGDTAVSEAKDRIRTAARNSGLEWPRTKIVVSLSPASLPKNGSGYDLALSCSVLAAKNHDTKIKETLREAVLIGELGLDGTVKPVPGALAAALAAREASIKHVVVPEENANEASLISGIHVWAVSTLAGAWRWVLDSAKGKQIQSSDSTQNSEECNRLDSPLENRTAMWDQSTTDGTTYGQKAIAFASECDEDARGYRRVPPTAFSHARQKSAQSTMSELPDMRDVIGQQTARRGLEIAAAGGHHMLMIGPPGSGKSMLAARMPGILPLLTENECLEVTAIHSLSAGQTESSIFASPPFIDPHYSVSAAGLLGGGSGIPKPGAVSLAHRGVLFLDEVGEMKSGVLDSLRTPLEQGFVRIIRNRHSVVYPANFQLILAANPCPCGASRAQECRCGGNARSRYLSRLSGPLLDRIDIAVTTEPINTSVFSRPLKGQQGSVEETSATIQQRVAMAQQRARDRWRSVGIEGTTNGRVPASLLRSWLEKETAQPVAAYLDYLLSEGTLTQRGVDRTIRVAITIADLADNAAHPENATQVLEWEAGESLEVLLGHVTMDHIDEALDLHSEIEEIGL